jgi:transposase
MGVVDEVGWNRNQALRLPRNLQLCFLPPYAPALNPVVHLWNAVREKSFPYRVFDSIDSLEAHREQALAHFEKSPHRTRGITGWPWISTALSI